MNPMTRGDGTQKLCVAIELSAKTWKLGFGVDLQAPRVRSIEAHDMVAFAQEVERAKAKLGLADDAPVLCCYEAGRDGFWLHRWLVQHGFENVVVDPASIEVDRRKRRRKTDRLDAIKLVLRLIRHLWGEKVWSVVRVPTAEMEDRRRVARERERLMKERVQHQARIRGLLATVGIRAARLDGALEAAGAEQGRPLPPRLEAELKREVERLQLVVKQLSTVEHALEAEAKTADGVGTQVQVLGKLKAVGLVASRVLALEYFWRDFRNPREVGAAAGLTGTPHQSGEMAHEQGVSKAGNRRVRAVILEISWLWLRYQPDSELSRWFERRFGHAAGRMRRIGIVALARRLLIALWRYATQGVLIEGAVMKAAA